MTPDQVALVRTSFDKVRPISEEAARLFYARLFEIAPEVRPLFKSNMAEQGRKLMGALALVVNGLDDLAKLGPAVEALGKRHAAYGVTDDHYQPVGAALIWTLEQGLGPDFTAEVRTAWIDAYLALADIMQDAAASADQVPSPIRSAS